MPGTQRVIVPAELAASLYAAERDARPIEPLRSTYPELTLVDAYSVQDAYVRMRASAGATLVGYKVGATSLAARELFGVDEPDFGHLFHDMRYESGAGIDLGMLIQPRIEAEFGFLLKEDLRGPKVTVPDVLAATARVVPCLEIIDSRVRDWDIGVVDTIADNGSSAKFVVGEPVPVHGDLSAVSVNLRRNADVVATGTGADVLGHPAMAVAWLANTFASMGRKLPSGSLVLSGSVTAPVGCGPDDAFSATFGGGLGQVRCTFVTK